MRFPTVLVILSVLSATASADNFTHGYTRRDGTYVQPHMKSEQNQYKFDNYSSRGNINPYTGSAGTHRNEFSSPPSFNKNYGNPSYGHSSGGSTRRR